MAIIAPSLLKQSVFGSKVETTTGTEISLAAADGTAIMYDADIEHDAEFNQRQGQGSLDQHEGIPGAFVATVRGTGELQGSGSTNAGNLDRYLLASGFAVSVGTSRVYTPVTGASDMTSLTCGKWVDGRKYCARGVTFDFVMRGESAKQVMIEYTGKGGWVAPADEANIAPTYVITPVPPRLQAATFTIGGTAYISRGFELGMQNVIAVRRDFGSPNGVHSTAVTDRNPYIQFDVEAGSKDWYADYAAGATAAGSIVIGEDEGNTFRITVPKMQQVQPPQKIDIDGVAGYTLRFQCVRNSAAGDDCLSIAQE
ncbi:MAG TPA: phage tail tube protein [Gemmata sp.]